MFDVVGTNYTSLKLHKSGHFPGFKLETGACRNDKKKTNRDLRRPSSIWSRPNPRLAVSVSIKEEQEELPHLIMSPFYAIIFHYF